MNFVNALKETANFTTTENGAGALKSTNCACLDAFGSLGAMRNNHDNGTRAINTFMAAFRENRELAMRMLFYMRDIRGGQGERQIFRDIVTYLATNYSALIESNLPNFLKFGRADDILCLLDTQVSNTVIEFIAFVLSADIKAMNKGESITLMAKWLPSVNASSEKTKHYARKICKGLQWTERQYRKTLSRLRNYLKVVETKMSARDWGSIDYEAVPSKAASLYSKAFYNHDPKRYTNYVIDAANGKAKINAQALFPVDIIHKIRGMGWTNDELQRAVLNAQWENLPNYFEGTNESAICMVDTSGSMSGQPIEVAISLGLYCADKCSGPFKGHFITFDSMPTIQEVKGRDIYEKAQLRSINCANTNIEAAFYLILKTAIENHAKQEDIPNKLYIISDMQFDEARGSGWSTRPPKPLTFMQTMREKFALYGYTLPSIVYWNVRASQCGMFQETIDGENCAIVSGYSPSLFEAVIKGTTYETEITEDGKEVIRQKIDPMTVMMNTLMDERYDSVIWA